jgi:CubicO group peptidase (beta-lactamase class C family)
MATLGRIVEVVSGQPYEKFVEDRILRPLGMKDTFFYPPEEKWSRIAMLYARDGGHLVKAGPDTQGGDPWNYRKGARYPCPECGLFSTAADLFPLLSDVPKQRGIQRCPSTLAADRRTGD